MSDLSIRARGLLNFAEQSVEEGLLDKAQSAEYFDEADCAIRILQKMLLKEDEYQHAQLMLMMVFDTSFIGISQIESHAQREQYFQEALSKIRFAKTLFE